MKIKRENLPKSRVKLIIEVPAEKMQDFFDEAYQKLAPTAEIKGFRSGQAPRSMILESIGQGRYQQQVINLALPPTYMEAIKREKINPIQTPSVAIKEFGENKNFVYEAEVDIIPEIKLGDYKKIQVKDTRKKHEAKKEEVEKILHRLQYQSAQFKDVNRSAQKGDRIEIDFKGSIDKVEQENLSSSNHPIIIGAGSLIPGFEEKLIGLKKEDEKEFDLEVPHVKDRFKTKKAHFKIKVNNVQEAILPIVNDEFAKKFGHKNPEGLKKAVAKNIIFEKEAKDRRDLENTILGKLLEKCQIETPESLVEQEVNRRLSRIQAQTGPGFQKFLEKIKKSIEDLRKDLRPEAERTVKIGLALGELARAEGIAPKGPIKDQKIQAEVTRKTINKLLEYAVK